MLGRNDLCWCGSGKKFKRCHLGRDRQPPPTTGEVIAALSTEGTRAIRKCFHPSSPTGCSSGIIKAHTVQRSGALDRIARNNHVYHFQGDSAQAAKSGGLDFQPVLIGIRQASTYPMFCSRHDTEIFKELDTEVFRGSARQIFQLAYRAVCQELCACLTRMAMLPGQRELDRGKPEPFQMFYQAWHNIFTAVSEAGLGGIKKHKQLLDEVLLSGSYSDINSYQISFHTSVPFLVTGVVAPEFDFTGARLQNTRSIEPDLEKVTCSMVPNETGSTFVLAWLGTMPCVNRLVDTLDALSDKELADAVCRFVFLSFDNIYASPDWWDGLDEVTRQGMIVRCLRGVLPPFPYEGRHLRNDGLAFLEWRVNSRTRSTVVQRA